VPLPWPRVARVGDEMTWSIICGDSREVVPTIPAEQRRRILCDPPYGKGHYRTDKDVCVGVLAEVVQEAQTVALKGYPVNVHQWFIALGLTPQEWIAWYPTNYACKANGNSLGLPKWHEDIGVHGDVPGARRLTRERADHAVSRRINELHRSKSKDHAKTYDPNGPARMGDVWTDASPGIAFKAADRLHPNETPVTLCLKLVELCTNPGDTILDPFAGSASMGVAALRLGRHYVGIEVNPEWAELCRERLQAESEGSTLAAARAGQVPLFGRAG